MALLQTSISTSEPVSVAEIKDHLRIPTTAEGGSTTEDTLLQSYITVARNLAENRMKRQIVNAEWKYTINDFPCSTCSIELLRPPLSTVSTNVAITYINSTVAGSSSTTVQSTVYTVDSDLEPGRIYPIYGQQWPSDALDIRSAVTITYRSGYTTSTVVPEEIKLWIKMKVGVMYEHREPITTDRITNLDRNHFDGLLDKYTIMTVEK